MNQNIATDKIIDSIQRQLGRKVLNENQIAIVHHHLILMYGVGFNEGLTISRLRRTVIQYNKEGDIHKFRTAKDAARYMKTEVGNIYKAASGRHHKCCGYFWRYM
jgi:hypothetical protein